MIRGETASAIEDSQAMPIGHYLIDIGYAWTFDSVEAFIVREATNFNYSFHAEQEER